MFFKGSRYEKSEVYAVTKPGGEVVSAVKPPPPLRNPLLGFHRRHEGHRLDHIASRYLADATAFWRLCDADDQIMPDALAARDLVGIPKKVR
jgi:hypothetical protein